MKLFKCISYSFVVLIIFVGCYDNNEKNVKVADYNAKIASIHQLSSQNKSYVSEVFSDNLILIAGDKNIELVNISSGNKKSSSRLNFKKPEFGINNKLKSISRSSTDSEIVSEDKPEIYSMLKLEDGILVGGKFNIVNGQEKENLVKLKFDGSIDNSFIGNVKGAVFKIVQVKDAIYIAGHIGGYNLKEANGIVKVDMFGVQDDNYNPFKEYLYTTINDIVEIDNKILLLAGSFFNDEKVLEEKNIDSIKDKVKSVMAIDLVGNIDEEYSNKFIDINKESFSIEKDDKNKRVYIGGNFEIYKNEKKYINLVRYSFEGILDESFYVEELYGRVYDIKIDGSTVIAGGDFVSALKDSNVRSLIILDENGNTVSTDLTTDCASIYTINIMNKSIVLTGDGNYTIGGANYENNIVLNLNYDKEEK